MSKEKIGTQETNKKKKKKWPIILGVVIVIIALVFIFGGNAPSVDDGASYSTDNLLEDNSELFGNPNGCIGKSVDIYGQIFNEVPSDGDGTYFQMYTDVENYENDVMVYVADGYKVEEEKNVHVTGVVTDTYTGENMLGGEITCAVISANSIEDASYAEAYAPALKTIEPNEALTAGDVEISVDKVEFAESETRLYVTIANNGSDSADTSPYSAMIVQEGSQFEYEENYNADYELLPDTLKPGVKASGVMVFPAIEPSEFIFSMDIFSGDEYYESESITIKVD